MAVIRQTKQQTCWSACSKHVMEENILTMKKQRKIKEVGEVKTSRLRLVDNASEQSHLAYANPKLCQLSRVCHKTILA